MTSIRSIGGVSIFSGDPRTLAEWYASHLGLRAREDRKTGAFYCDFYTPDPENPDLPRRTAWTLHPSGDDPPPPSDGFVLSYVVDNLASALEQLRSKGVEIDRVEEHFAGRSAWIKDPEGHVIELWED